MDYIEKKELVHKQEECMQICNIFFEEMLKTGPKKPSSNKIIYSKQTNLCACVLNYLKKN